MGGGKRNEKKASVQKTPKDREIEELQNLKMNPS